MVRQLPTNSFNSNRAAGPTQDVHFEYLHTPGQRIPALLARQNRNSEETWR